MRYSVPHPIPYQGSKRRLAATILGYIQLGHLTRLVEPFAGSAAVTLAAASQKKFDSFIVGDSLEPLIYLWQAIVQDPSTIAEQYKTLWYRERDKPIDAYYEIRSEFNTDRTPSKLLYLLARCVKNAVRFNPKGEFNQSPDKRRQGTRPQTMAAEIQAAHEILANRCVAVHADFLSLVLNSQEGDFFYLDPPYQGTSEGKDQRYVSGVSRDRIIEALEILNDRKIPFILSYDGSCGGKSYGESLPANIARQISLDVGRSSQATLNGLDHNTVESIYVSHMISVKEERKKLSLSDFAQQTMLFS